jgi:DNA-binding PadR family transcriptional regulator
LTAPGSLDDNCYLSLKDSQLVREILLSFWKIHILHHAGEGTVYGQWMIEELRRHGYDISPGTLYPLLRRMESNGWLKPVKARGVGVRERHEYRLTKLGSQALELIRAQLDELYREVAPRPGKRKARAA